MKDEPKLKAVNFSESGETPSQRDGLNFSGSSKYLGLYSENINFLFQLPWLFNTEREVRTYANHIYDNLEHQQNVSSKQCESKSRSPWYL